MKKQKKDLGHFRIAEDSMGKMKIPKEMLYGASTQRAVLNFPISGRRFPRSFIHALGQIKMSAAKANAKLRLLTSGQAQAIEKAAREVRDGQWDEHFVLDIFQTGSGTSTNMNANEVIASLANQSLQLSSDSKNRIHPNDHVNKGQSSNDVIPTAIHVSVLLQLRDHLIPELKKLQTALLKKARKFHPIFKIGRTHLQDATPIRLGQEFGGYAEQVKKAIERVEKCFPSLRELAIGGTAVGTGINTHPLFAREVCDDLNRELGEKVFEARNHFEAQAAKDACVEASGTLKVVAVSLLKIANDIRWLSCGPRAGIAELKLPEVQPGSSIMPGKVNPVMAEAMMQVACEVIGNDLAVTLAAQHGNFELNVMMPVMVYNLLESIRLLSNAVSVFRSKCVDGIQDDRMRCESVIEKTLMLSTPLVPVIGYDRAAQVAKEAYRTGKTIRQVVLEKRLLGEKQLSRILDIKKMV
ncbi:MAG TPA: class II fumarate hydratase [Candidatus Omnitrophota bacterium]|nr:class II fumarate hydratase [Candidatus Omnitrophota bacterium]